MPKRRVTTTKRQREQAKRDRQQRKAERRANRGNSDEQTSDIAPLEQDELPPEPAEPAAFVDDAR
jgi:hypothetical protein